MMPITEIKVKIKIYHNIKSCKRQFLAYTIVKVKVCCTVWYNKYPLMLYLLHHRCLFILHIEVKNPSYNHDKKIYFYRLFS